MQLAVLHTFDKLGSRMVPEQMPEPWCPNGLPRTVKRYTFVAVMTAFFVLGLVRARNRWERYQETVRPGRDAPYSAYLAYNIRQALDLHWLPLLPLRVMDKLPAGLDLAGRPHQRNELVRVAAAILLVSVFWLLVALWFEHLTYGPGWIGAEHAVGGVGAIVFAALALFVIRCQANDGPDSSPLSDAALVPVLSLLLMSMAQCGWLGKILRAKWTYVVVPILFTCTFIWADRRYRAEFQASQNRYRACLEESKTREVLCWQFPFSASPAVQDAMWLHLPPALVLELSGILRPTIPRTPRRFAVSALVVASYWCLVWALAASTSGPFSRTKTAIRPFAVVFLRMAFAFLFLGWMIGGPHGYNGTFGGLLATASLWSAFDAAHRRPLE